MCKRVPQDRKNPGLLLFAGQWLPHVLLSPEPEHERRQPHKNARHAERPTVAVLVAEHRNYLKSKRCAVVDGPIEKSVHFGQPVLLMRPELISHKRRHAWFDSTGPDSQQDEAEINSSKVAFKQRECSVSRAVKQRDA